MALLNEKSHKFPQLDSLRGIASMQVLLHHVLLLSPIFYSLSSDYSQSQTVLQKIVFFIKFTPIHFLFTGAEAVLFFFVLSGFVLASSIKNRVTPASYKAYLIKRFFRLYVPVVFVILLSSVLIYFCHRIIPTDNLSDWGTGIWARPITLDEFFGLSTFLSRALIHNVDTTLWSIEVEIKLSIFVPLIYLFINAFKKYKFIDILWCICLLYIAYYISYDRTVNRLFIEDPQKIYDSRVMRYLSAFIAGILLYKYLPFFLKYTNRLNKLWVWIIMSVTILFYSFTWLLWPFKDLNSPVINFLSAHDLEVMIITSCIFILLSFNKHIVKLLLNSFLLFSGKISFSLYLVHPLVIGFIIYSTGNALPLPFACVLIIIISFIVAGAMYKYVERPTNNLGRRLSKNRNISPVGNIPNIIENSVEK